MTKVGWGYATDPQFDRKEAVRLMRLALSVDDDDPDTLGWASLISSFIVGDCEAEIAMVDRAVGLNPNSLRAWSGRGLAVRSFERAIRMSPVDPELHHSFAGIGYALIELSRFDEAIIAGKNSFYPEAYRCLSSAFAHLGRKDEARVATAHLLEVDPAVTISSWRARGGHSNATLLTEGLRKAGLPE